MELFLLLATIYLLLFNGVIVLVILKERSIFFWGLISILFTPFATLFFMLYLGDSEQIKEEKALHALREIALLEYDALCDFENKHCLSKYRDLIIAGRLKRKAMSPSANVISKVN